MAKSSVDLIVNAVKAINPLRQVAAASKKAEQAINSLKKAAKDTGDKLADMGRKGKKGLSDLAKKAGQAVGKFGKLGKAAALAAAAAGAAAFLKFSFGQAGELERQTKSLQVLTGSLDTAKGIISELQAFGAVTPFTSQELIETAKRLKAFGFQTEQVVDITKRLSDVAGATGADLSGIATAFGQIQAKGRLQGEELLQLQERGVALGDELKKMYGLTGEEFSKALQKGQISAKAAEVALIRLTEQGGQYANGAIAQSDTLFGKLSTLQDAIGRFGQNIGKVLSPIFKGIIEFLTTITNQINNIFKEAELENQARKNLGLDKKGSARQFFKEGGRALLDAEKERLRAEGFGKEPIKTPDLTVPELTAGTLGGGTTSRGKTEAEKEADRLADIAKKNAAEIKALEDKTLLASALNDEERKRFERQIEMAEILRNEVGLNEKQLKDKIEATLNLYEQEDATQAIIDKNKERLDQERQLKEAAKRLKDLYKSIGEQISTGIVDTLMEAKSASEALGGVLNNVARQMMQLGVNTLLKATGFDIFKNLGGLFANGGRPPVGRPSIVGERGPELFVPDRAGTILPNGVGMGSNISVNVNVDASGSSVEGNEDEGAQLGKLIGAAVQQELLNQKRPGGLLAGV